MWMIKRLFVLAILLIAALGTAIRKREANSEET